MQEFLSLPGVYCLPILKKSHPDKKTGVAPFALHHSRLKLNISYMGLCYPRNQVSRKG